MAGSIFISTSTVCILWIPKLEVVHNVGRDCETGIAGSYIHKRLWNMPGLGHYSGVYPPGVTDARTMHFRVHLLGNLPCNSLNSARLGRTEKEGRIALAASPSG